MLYFVDLIAGSCSVSKLKQHGIDAILNVSKVDYEDRLSRDIDYRFHLLRDEDSENMASVLPQLTDFIRMLPILCPAFEN